MWTTQKTEFCLDAMLQGNHQDRAYDDEKLFGFSVRFLKVTLGRNSKAILEFQFQNTIFLN